jgi:hypothetical protein
MKSLSLWMMLLLFTCGNLVAAVAKDNVGETGAENEERHFESLTVGALSFTNVWVHRQTNTVILIRHSRGIHSIKLSDLPHEELTELKSQIGDLAELPPTEKSGWRNSAFVQKLLVMYEGSSGRTRIILGIVVFLLVLLVIAKKLGRKSVVAAP